MATIPAAGFGSLEHDAVHCGPAPRKADFVRSCELEVYIGSLPWSTTEEQLKKLFSAFGTVEKVFIPYDRSLERPKGYGFVTLLDDVAAEKAIATLDGIVFQGRTLRISKGRGVRRLF
jgi:RNA recognition motif-containing protein